MPFLSRLRPRGLRARAAPRAAAASRPVTLPGAPMTKTRLLRIGACALAPSSWPRRPSRNRLRRRPSRRRCSSRRCSCRPRPSCRRRRRDSRWRRRTIPCNSHDRMGATTPTDMARHNRRNRTDPRNLAPHRNTQTTMEPRGINHNPAVSILYAGTWIRADASGQGTFDLLLTPYTGLLGVTMKTQISKRAKYSFPDTRQRLCSFPCRAHRRLTSPRR